MDTTMATTDFVVHNVPKYVLQENRLKEIEQDIIEILVARSYSRGDIDGYEACEALQGITMYEFQELLRKLHIPVLADTKENAQIEADFNPE